MITEIVDLLTERVFPLVTLAARTAIIPALRGKGVKVVSQGADFGEIVTEMDMSASDIILNGLRADLPGSFSEEDDSPERTRVLELWQVDPCDGTGDAVKTANSDRVVGPTMLVSLLRRSSITAPFRPVGALIYDVLGEYGVVSDGKTLLLGKPCSGGEWVRVLHRTHRSVGVTVSIPKRISYPQNHAHNFFPDFMRWMGFLPTLNQVEVGGAGDQALRLVRASIAPVDPSDVPAFARLRPVDAVFNAQPDWKTWDLDPLQVIAEALNYSWTSDIYGQPLRANACANAPAGMHHTTGCVITRWRSLSETLVTMARKYEEAYGDGSLLTKNY